MFRRNKSKNIRGRTPLAKRKAPVFSYYSSNLGTESGNASNLEIGRRPKHRSPKAATKYLHQLPTYLAISLIVISLLYATTLNTQPKILIGSYNKKGHSLVRSSTVYQSTAHDLLASSILNRSKLTINTDSLAAAIEAQFPEITRATVTVPILGQRPIIGLDPALPTIIVSSTSGSFVVGEDGKALVSTHDVASDNLDLPIVQDQGGLSLEQGKVVLPKQTVAFITTILDQFTAKHIPIESMTLPEIANELHIKITGVSYYIKFNLQGDARQQVGTYLAVKEKLSKDGITPAEYIDLRVDERAYYK